MTTHTQTYPCIVRGIVAEEVPLQAPACRRSGNDPEWDRLRLWLQCSSGRRYRHSWHLPHDSIRLAGWRNGCADGHGHAHARCHHSHGCCTAWGDHCIAHRRCVPCCRASPWPQRRTDGRRASSYAPGVAPAPVARGTAGGVINCASAPAAAADIAGEASTPRAAFVSFVRPCGHGACHRGCRRHCAPFVRRGGARGVERLRWRGASQRHGRGPSSRCAL